MYSYIGLYGCNFLDLYIYIFISNSLKTFFCVGLFSVTSQRRVYIHRIARGFHFYLGLPYLYNAEYKTCVYVRGGVI